MSNTRFCGSCFAGTPFTSIRPVSCAKCGKPFEAAFAVATPLVSQTAAPGQVVSSRGSAPVQGRRVFRTVRGREIPLSQPVQAYDGPDDLEDDGDESEDRQVTRAEIKEEAQALAATLDAADFGLSIGDASGMGASKSFKFESLPFVQQAQQAAQNGGKPKKAARKGGKK